MTIGQKRNMTSDSQPGISTRCPHLSSSNCGERLSTNVQIPQFTGEKLIPQKDVCIVHVCEREREEQRERDETERWRERRNRLDIIWSGALVFVMCLPCPSPIPFLLILPEEQTSSLGELGFLGPLGGLYELEELPSVAQQFWLGSSPDVSSRATVSHYPTFGVYLGPRGPLSSCCLFSLPLSSSPKG